MSDDDVKRYYESRQLKNNGVALVFAIILGFFGLLGIGHIYIGRVGKGIAYLISGFIVLGFGVMLASVLSYMGLIFGVALFIILLINSIFGVRKSCDEFNEYFIRTKKRLW
jgi:TM2 domain-containing membrane protein YozV